MRQAITTKYLGPTNFRGSRVKASCQAGSLTLEWDDSQNSDANHIAAAQALASRYGWDGEWLGGGTLDGCVFTQWGEDNAFCCEASLEGRAAPRKSVAKTDRYGNVPDYLKPLIDG